MPDKHRAPMPHAFDVADIVMMEKDRAKVAQFIQDFAVGCRDSALKAYEQAMLEAASALATVNSAMAKSEEELCIAYGVIRKATEVLRLIAMKGGDDESLLEKGMREAAELGLKQMLTAIQPFPRSRLQ